MILQFPIDRQWAEVTRCAGNLLTLHGERANVYWRHEMQELAARLRRCGVDDAGISRHALAFTIAVQSEVMRLHRSRAVVEELDEGRRLDSCVFYAMIPQF